MGFPPAGQEAEEEGPGPDDGADPDEEDIFELEGMVVDLGIGGGDPEEAARRRRQSRSEYSISAAAGVADRGGWEGTAASVAAAAVAAKAAAAAASSSGRPASAAVDETANKLDCLMELVLGHLTRRQEAGAQ